MNVRDRGKVLELDPEWKIIPFPVGQWFRRATG
jgi:hypothetical protein